MANWLERAKREIQKIPYRPTAKTDETPVMAVSAVPQLGESGISRASIVSNGSSHNGPYAGPEEISPALGAAYRRYWTTPETEPMTTFLSLHREIDILERQVGVDTAWRTLEEAARGWYAEHRVCPFCGAPGAPI